MSVVIESISGCMQYLQLNELSSCSPLKMMEHMKGCFGAWLELHTQKLLSEEGLHYHSSKGMFRNTAH